MSRLRMLLSLTLCLAGLASFAWGQATGGNIKGVVSDNEGKPLPGVTVTVSSKALMGGSRTTYSNEQGVFRFASLPVGNYTVDFEMQGFDKVHVETVTVGLDQTANVPITMEFMKVTEAITTIGETPLVDVTESQQSTNYAGPILDDVPQQHSQYLLMQMTPGVSANTGDAQGDRTVAYGSIQQSNAWHVDGVDLSAPETGAAWYTLNPDVIQEVQVIANGGAEYGNHMGAVFNVVTKSGSNEFHGTGNYYFLNDDLTGTSVDLDTGSESDVFHMQGFRQVSGTVGGPILKDRLWWFGAIQSERYAASQPGVIPSFAEDAPTISDKYDGKINARLGSKTDINGFFHWENFNGPNTPSPDYEPSALPTEEGHNPAWGVSATTAITPNLLLEAGYSGWTTTDLYDSAIGAPLEDPFLDFAPPPGGPTYNGGVYFTWDYRTWRSTFRGKVTTYADNFMNTDHEFKFGVQYSRGHNESINGLGPNGFYTYHGEYYSYDTYQYEDYGYLVYRTPWAYGADTWETGIFIDDNVTVNDRLTLNLGVRFDHNIGDIPDFKRLTVGTPSITPVGNFKETDETLKGQNVVTWNLVSPRVGFVFQPQKGISKVTGSFGIYYDHDVTGNWDYPPPGSPPYVYFPIDQETGEVATEPAFVVGETFTLANDIDPPRTLNYSVGYEHQIGKSMAVGTQFIYKKTNNMVGWMSIGGAFEPFDYVDEVTGTHYTLLNVIEGQEPILTRGNNPGNQCEIAPWASMCADGPLPDYHSNYHGLLFTFQKRFAEDWALNMNYTWSRVEGLSARPLSQNANNPSYGYTDSADLINTYLNAQGRLQSDRPHMFRAQAVFYKLPAGLHASVLADFSSGKPLFRVVRLGSTVLNQGTSTIIMERDFRFPTFKNIDITVGRRFNLGSTAQVRLEGTVYNLLNSDHFLELINLRFDTLSDVAPSLWAQPRRLELRAGFQF